MRSGIIRGFSSAFSPGNQVPVGEAEPIRACWPKNGLLGAPVADLRIPQGIVYRTIGLRDDRSIDAVVCEIGCSSTGRGHLSHPHLTAGLTGPSELPMFRRRTTRDRNLRSAQRREPGT